MDHRLRDRLATTSDVVSACRAVVDLLVADGFTMPSIYLRRGGRLRCHAARGYWQIVDGFPPGVGVMGQVVESGRPVVVDDARTHPDFVAAVEDVRGEATAPITVGGEVVGVINIETRTVLPADAVTRIVWCAAALADHIEQLGGLPEGSPAEQLADHVVAISELTETAAIAERVVTAATALSGMPTGVLARRGAGSQLAVSVAAGPLAAPARTWTAADLGAIDATVAHGASSYFAGDGASTSSAFALVSAGIESVIVVPLAGGGAHDGFLLVADTVASRPETGLVRWLEQLAVQASSRIAVVELVGQLADQARRDPLTGLGNATAFAEWQVASRADHDGLMALLMIDFDHFKRVNDTHGHLAGDRLLCDGAATLLAAMRRRDQLYRIGGDEFAALIEVESSAEAEMIAARLGAAARANGTFTISVGIATTSAADLDDATRARADDALYHAKRLGRDTIVVHGVDRHAGVVEPAGPRGDVA